MRPASAASDAVLKGLVCLLIGLGGVSALSAQTLPAQRVAALRVQTQPFAVGAVHPDVVIVEYLDYNCPYCRKSAPELVKLMKSDSGVGIVFKEWPIFGDASVYAARSALAASWQGKFGAAHEALISATRDLDQNADVDAALRATPGLDLARLASDRKRHAGEIDAILARSTQETQALGLQGTPVFIVGQQLINSSLNLAQLKKLVAQARGPRQ
jgi:protein-disulfide isomerase